MKAKYRYNPQTLAYEKVRMSFKRGLLITSSILLLAITIGFGFFILFSSLLDSPKEIELSRENQRLQQQYYVLNKKMSQASEVLKSIEERDNYVYREIFESEPIPENIRNAGFGGVNRYKDLEGYENSELLVQTSQKIDQLSKRLYIQSKSFDDVTSLAKQKTQMLASIPAIQPIPNKELKRMASGFGMRIDPHYKVPTFHSGNDFTAATGTDIYATGDGKVVKVKSERRSYGKHILIDHGFGYKTLYGHMSAFNVRVGQTVKRGEVIGKVGNTGKSTGPHLHYEVWRNNEKINPVNFYYNDLTPEQYDEMIEISSQSNQSFD